MRASEQQCLFLLSLCRPWLGLSPRICLCLTHSLGLRVCLCRCLCGIVSYALCLCARAARPGACAVGSSESECERALSWSESGKTSGGDGRLAPVFN